MRWGGIENYLYIELKIGEIFLLRLDQISFKKSKISRWFPKHTFSKQKNARKRRYCSPDSRINSWESWFIFYL
jgi:hypothetical protein